MATHNTIRLVGYVSEPPTMTEHQTIVFPLKVRRREAMDVQDKYTIVNVYYDGDNLMPRLKQIKQYDFIDLKGNVNVANQTVGFRCPECGQTILYSSCQVFVYPIWFAKIAKEEINRLLPKSTDPDIDQKSLLNEVLTYYDEVSDYCTMLGTVVTDPCDVSRGNYAICHYKIAVNRKFFIKTQATQYDDYPYVVSYGEQAAEDMKRLSVGSVVLIDGYLCSREEQKHFHCDNCDSDVERSVMFTDLIPFAVEYLSNYKTDEDIAKEEEQKERDKIMKAATMRA